MNKHLSLCALLAFSLVGTAMAADFVVRFGRGAGEVAFLNTTTHPEPFGGVMPQGPMSFRLIDGRAIVVDTVAGRVLHFVADGNGCTAWPIATGAIACLGDVAPARGPHGGGLWVVNRLTQVVVLLDATGKPIKTVGGLGEKPGQFLDVVRLETAADGRLYAWDVGRRVVALFAADGTLTREFVDAGAGFCLDGSGTPVIGVWSETNPRLRLRHETQPTATTIETDLESEVPPVLWGTVGTEHLVGCVAGDDPKITAKMTRLAANGKTVVVLPLPAAQNMVRPVCVDERGQVWLATGNYDAAPTGTLRLQKLDLGGTPEG